MSIPPSGHPFRIALVALAVLLAALIFRIGLLGVPAMFDEYYHLLAARGWLDTGRPTILDGEYIRTTGFTGAVAWLFSMTGSTSLETGRLVALPAGVLIPVVLFLWLRARAGWTAGLTGAGLAILWPQGIWEAQLLRFYSWHCLSFLVGAIAIFEAAGARGLQRTLWTGLAILGFALAFYLQITTIIGLAAIFAWIGAVLILPALWRHPRRWPLLGGLAAAAIVVLALLAFGGILPELWERYRWVPGWSERRQDYVTYYIRHLRGTYPVLWPLFPVAALLAYRQQPRITLFCTLVFAIILVGQSFGGMKAARYLSYGMPFFFAVYALAAASVLPAAGTAVLRGAEALNPTRFRWVTQGLVIVALAFAAMFNPFFSSSLKAVTGTVPEHWAAKSLDWSRLPALVGDWQEAPFRLTTHEVHTIFALGDYDVLFSPNRLTELSEQAEFSVDHRTGRPVVAELDTIATILRCEPEGLLLSDEEFWSPQGEEDLLPLFEAAGRKVEIRQQHQLVALHWTGGPADAAACAALPR